jgi:DNA-binding LytR/AlgR family response regulator
MLTCVLVDDEQHAIDLLKFHIQKIDYLQVIKTFNNPLDALYFLDENTVDLVFLDIHMPEISGIDLIKYLRRKTAVIITSAHREYALEGFEHDVMDYLLKPVSFDRFLQAVQKAKEKIKAQNRSPATTYEDFIVLKTESKTKLLKVDLADILYIEGLQNYVSVFTRHQQRIMTKLNMKTFEERLPKAQFIRIQKSYIVSLSQVKQVDGNQVILKDTEQKLPIGDNYRNALFTLLKEKLVENK